MPATRREILEARLVWLRQALVDLDRVRARVPFIPALSLLAIPAWLVWGPLAALLVLLTVVFLAVVAFYIAWNHRNEYETEIESIERDLAQPDDAAARPTTWAAPAPPPPPVWGPVRRRRVGWL